MKASYPHTINVSFQEAIKYESASSHWRIQEIEKLTCGAD